MQNEIENTTCRLCLAPCNGFFENIDAVAIQMLKTLGLGFDVDISEKHVMCKSCSETLQRCFDFKIICLRTEDCISSFRNDRNNVELDLRDLYIRKNGNGDNTLSNCCTVCRLCMELAELGCCISLNSDTKDVTLVRTILRTYFSELDLKIAKDPVICASCNESLRSHFSFIKSCLDKATKPQIESNSGLQYRTENISNNKNDCTSTGIHENCNENELRDEIKMKFENPVQTEPQEFHIKHEVNEHEERDGIKIEDLKNTVEKCENEQICGSELNSENFKQTEGHRFNIKYGEIDIKTEDEDTARFQHSMLIPKDESLERHMLVHKNVSEETMYACELCTYKTKRKSHLTQHTLIHKHASEVTLHQCDICTFRTRHKNSLKQHMLIHRNASDVTTYSCGICTYTAKQRSNLKSHMLIHKNASEVTMYSCGTCTYVTRHKGTLKRHTLIHKDTSEVSLHQCDICTYQTIHKNSLKQHMLIHKNASEVTTYSCGICTYKTKQRRNLKKHMLIHANASEVATYSCETCAYKAKEKGNLNRHMLSHKNTSEVATYSCGICTYKAKLKGNLEKHMLIHKNASEVTMYSCEVCTYKAKRKGGLKQHMLIHGNVSEATTCQWDMYIQGMTQKRSQPDT